MAKNYLEDKGLTTPVEGEAEVLARITGGKLATVIEGMYKNRGWRVASFFSSDTAPIELGVDNQLKYRLRKGDSEDTLKKNLSRIVNDVVSKVDARIKHRQAEANMSLDSLSKFHSAGVLFGIDDLVEGPSGAAFIAQAQEAQDNEPLSQAEITKFGQAFRAANNLIDNAPLRKNLVKRPALVRQVNELYQQGIKFTLTEEGLAFPMGAPLEADEVNALIDILNISVDPSIGGESLSDQVRKFPTLARAIVVIATDLRQSLSKAGVPQVKIDQMNVEQLINHHSSGGIKSPRIQALLRKATENIDANLGAQVTKFLSKSENLRLMVSQGEDLSAIIRSTMEPALPEISPQNKYAMDNRRSAENIGLIKALEDTLPSLEEKLVTHAEAINSKESEISLAEKVVQGYQTKAKKPSTTKARKDPLTTPKYLGQLEALDKLRKELQELVSDSQRIEENIKSTQELIKTRQKLVTGKDIPVEERIRAVEAVNKIIANSAKMSDQEVDLRSRSAWITYSEAPVAEDINKDLLELTTQEDPDAPVAEAPAEEIAQMKEEASILGLESGNPNSVRRLISNLANSSGAKIYPHLQGLAKVMLASDEIMGSITDVKIINDPSIAADGSFVDGVLTINYAAITSNIVTTDTAASLTGAPAPASDVVDATNLVDVIIRSILAGHTQQLTAPGAQLTPRQAEALKELDSLRQEAIRAEKESRHFALAPRFMSELSSTEAFVNALLTSPELASFLSTFKTKAVKPTLTSLWGRLWKAFASLLTGKDAPFGSSLHVSLMTAGRLLPFKAPKNAHLASDLMKVLSNPGLAMVQTRLATQEDVIVSRAVVDVTEAVSDPANEAGLDDRAENGPDDGNDPENIRGQELAIFPSGSPLVTSPAPTGPPAPARSLFIPRDSETLTEQQAFVGLAEAIRTVDQVDKVVRGVLTPNEAGPTVVPAAIQSALDAITAALERLKNSPAANKDQFISILEDMQAFLQLEQEQTVAVTQAKFTPPPDLTPEEKLQRWKVLYDLLPKREQPQPTPTTSEEAPVAPEEAPVAPEEAPVAPEEPTLTPEEENVVVEGYTPDLLDDLIDAALEGSGIPVSFVTEKDFPQAGESPMFVRTDGLDDRIFVNRAALRTQIISWRSENKGTIKDVNRLLKSMIDEEIDHLIVVSRFLNGDLLAVMDNLSRDDRRQVLADYFDIKNIGSADAAKAMGEHASQTPEEQARARVAFAHEYLRMVKQRAATGYRTEDATKMGGQKLGLIARVGAYLRATTTRVITRWNAYGDPYALRAILHINDYSRAMGIKPHPEVSGIIATIEPMAGGTPEDEEVDVVGARSIAPVTEEDFKFLELAKDPEKNQSLLQQIVDAVAVAAGYTPMRVYHGTKKRRFTVFDNSKGRTLDERDSVRSPIFFSENQEFAEDYANYGRPEKDKTPPKLYTVYLRIKNLWDYRNKANQDAAIKAFPDKATSIREGAWKFIESPPFQKWLLDQGHDGFVNNERFADNYAVYDPRQIKMADAIIRDSKGNIIPPSKRFNPESPSILAARPIGPRKPTSAIRFSQGGQANTSQDAEYLAAVEAGDMGAARRMMSKAYSSFVQNTIMLGDKFYPATFIRFGNPRTNADGAQVASKGFDGGTQEKGVSVIGVWYDPVRGKYVIPTGSEQAVAGISDLVLQNRPVFVVSGSVLEDVGSDTEPLMEAGTVKTQEQLNYSDLIEENNPDFTLDGEQYDSGEEGTKNAYTGGKEKWWKFKGKPFPSPEIVVRDSAGKVIPLSQRFNPESPSILAARPIGPRKPTSAMEGVLPVFPERVRDLLKSETYVSRIEADDISYVEDNIGDIIKDAKDPQDFLSLAHSLTSAGFRFTPAQTSLARGLIIAAMNRHIDALEASYTATPHPDTFLLKEQYEDASAYLTGVVMDQRSETGTLFQSFQQMDQILRPGTIARLYRKKMSARTDSELDKQPKAKKAAREILKGIKQSRSSAGKEAVSKSPLIKKVVGSMMKKLNLPESAGQTQFDFMSEMENLIGQMVDSPDDLRFRRNEIVSSVAKKMVERFVTPLLKTSPDTPPSIIEQVRAEVTKIVSFKINEALEGDTSSTAKVRPDSVTRLFERMGVASTFNNPYNVASLAEQAFNEAKLRILNGLVIPEGATQAQADEITRTYKAATDMSFDAVSAKSMNEIIRNAFKMREQMILNAEQQSLSIASLTSMVLEMGDLTQAQATAVATALKATYDRQVAEASEKFLKNYVASVEGSKSPEAVRLSQNERLLKLIYLGGFSTEEFYSAVADEFKIPTYDPEVAKSLEAEGRRVYNLPQGSVQRLDAVRDLNARMAKEYIDGMFKQLGKKALLKDREVLLTYLLDLPASAWKAGNLSGLGTSEINFVMGNLQAALDLGLNAVGYGIAAKDPGLLVQNFGTLVKAIFWPFDKNARAETWSEMKRAAFTGRTRFMSEQSESVMIMEQDIPVTPILRPGVALWKAIGRVIQVIDAAVSVPVNLARQRLVMSYAMQQEGMRGSDIREVLRNSFSPDELVMREIEDQLNQEQSQFDTSRRPDLMREARKFQLLEERRQEIAEAHGSYEDLIEAGRESARKANLSDIPSGLAGVVFNSLSRLEGRTRGATAPVTAFANSMGNLFDLGLGIGVPGLSPLLSIARAFNRSPSTFILPDNSKYRRKHVEYGSPDFYKLIAQSAFGLILQATIIPLFIKGLEDEDEDREPLFMVYGKGYSDPDKTRQLLLRQPRWKPNTIKLGDVYINWKDLPGLNMMFGGLASYTDYRLDTMAKDMSKVRTADTALRVTLGAFKAVFAKNAMQGLQDALELIDDSSTATLTAPQKTVKWATNLASGITNPRLLRDVADMSRGLADPDGEYKLFDSRGYTAAMVSMLPANTLYADALGVQEMINARGAPVTNFWYAPATKRILPTSADSGYDPIISPLVEAGLFLKPPTKDMAFKTYMNDSDAIDKKGATLGSFAPEVSTQAVKLYGDYMTQVLTANDGALINRLVEMAKAEGVNGIEKAQKMLDKLSSKGKDIAQRPIQRAILDRELVPHWQEQ